MTCEHIMYSKCDKNHDQSYKCHQGIPLTCCKCDKAQKLAEKKQQQAFALQQKRDAEQAAHLKEVAALEAEIAREVEAVQDVRRAKERAEFIQQKKRDLEAMKRGARVTTQQAASAPTPQSGSIKKRTPNKHDAQATQSDDDAHVPKSTENTLPPSAPSGACEDWQRRKEVEHANNDAIDGIMGLTGLEEIKSKVLEILDKIETARRRGTDLQKERFNIVFLGNPGTGTNWLFNIIAAEE